MLTIVTTCRHHSLEATQIILAWLIDIIRGFYDVCAKIMLLTIALVLFLL